jgi:CheY-like chemotaxis protein/HPt (histidine-containing phosphotransfer) domain-containing protein
MACLTKPIRQSLLFNTLVAVVQPDTGAELLQQSGQAAAPTAKMHHEGHLLLAEDNEVNQMVVTEILNNSGFTCDVVANGRLAVEAIARQSYALVLMDCQMPEMDGFQATIHLRTTETDGNHLPIIALTANATQEGRERCLAAGMDDFLSKPIHPQHLVQMIDKWLARCPQAPAAAETASIAVEEAMTVVPAEDPEVTDLLPIDFPALVDRCMGNAAFAEKMIDKFRTRACDDLEEIAAALAAGDIENAGKLAHKYKGATATLAAQPLSDLAAHMQTVCTAGDAEAAAACLPEMRQEAERLIDYLDHREQIHV